MLATSAAVGGIRRCRPRLLQAQTPTFRCLAARVKVGTARVVKANPEPSQHTMSTQSGVQVAEYRKDLEGAVLKELPIPEPGLGQALVRLLLRPVNPVDLELLHGARDVKLPYVSGFEGAS